jgi:membrane dipeptidase
VAPVERARKRHVNSRSVARAATIALLLLAAPASAQQPTAAQHRTAERALRTQPIIDGHNDLPWVIRRDSIARGDPARYNLRVKTPGHTDIARLRAGRVGAQFWSVYTPGDIRDSGYARVQLEQIDIARRFIERYPDIFELALSADDVRRIIRRRKVASLIGLEGGHALENSLAALRAYRELGVAYMTLTHNVTLDWADAANDSAKHGGLTEFGREVVREMNRLGMLVDLSHVSDGTMSDVLDVTAAPVIFSHSSARALTDVPRNVPDSILQRVRQNRGIVMVTFVPGFVSPEVAAHSRRRHEFELELARRFPDDTAARARELAQWDLANPPPRATLSQIADHIDYIRRVAGLEQVGIGSDFDGIEQVPIGLEDVATFPALFAELARRGWTERELRMLSGENILRVMRAAETVARRIQRERGPSMRTISDLDR